MNKKWNILYGLILLLTVTAEVLAVLGVKRLNMLPGMTGLAQVSGNIYLTLQNRYKLDVYYVEHFSLWMDIKILFRTVGVVVLGEERYVDKPLVSLEEK